MEISDQLLCLFNADVTESDGSYHVSIPRQEIDHGTIVPGETYRVAVIDRSDDGRATEAATTTPAPSGPQPPVEPGEIRYVEIEDIGKQGDGIARVERGYVIIVPGAEVGEQVKVEVSEVKSNFAVGEVIEEEIP